MTTVYTCQDLKRKTLVEDVDTLNGIDYIEVGDTSQMFINVFFLNPLPGQPNGVPAAVSALEAKNISITGGTRIPHVDVTSVIATGNKLIVQVKEPGDFSEYTFSIVTGDSNSSSPEGFDPVLSEIKFSFKALCETGFDCVSGVHGNDNVQEVPNLNYLAKDYQSFRKLMFDRLSVSLPDWDDRSPADPYIALVDALAYKADQLSYYQDAIATEAYINTARSRVSLRRHARLMDYFVDEGCNARSFVHLRVRKQSDAEMEILQRSTPLIAAGQDGATQIDIVQMESFMRDECMVFETMHDIELREAHNEFSLYTWEDSKCCLHAGALSATLLKNIDTKLKVGELLAFKQVLSPVTGVEADVDPEYVHIVRLTKVEEKTDPLNGTDVIEVGWHDQDALPFDLVISAEILDDNDTPVNVQTALVFGNIVAVDHGVSVADVDLDAVTYETRSMPFSYRDISFVAPYDVNSSAKSTLEQNENILPSLTLDDGGSQWGPQRDLLASDRFATDFVVEVEENGDVYLRFGDGEFGKAPGAGVQFKASCRIGNGEKGNIGRGALSKIMFDIDGIESVTNLVPATGGRNPENKQQIRQRVPEAFKTQKRAVTPDDYEAVLVAHEGIQGANASIRWTGSWYTVFVTVDRVGGLSLQDDLDFKEGLLRLLREYRLAGYDLEFRDPSYVPIDLALNICVKENVFASDVKSLVLKALGGYFTADNFTFGDPLYSSRIYAIVMGVDGVKSVEIRRFKRWGKEENEELELGVIETEAEEIIRLENNRNFPEHGQITVEVMGGG